VRGQLGQGDVAVVAGVEPAADLVVERDGARVHQRGQHGAGHRLGDRADLEPAVQRAAVAEPDRVPILVGGHRGELGRGGKLGG
jgi:hypothetical protein